MDAPESTVNYFSLSLDITNLCVEERILLFLVRPADLVNTFVQFQCCNSRFFFAMLSPLLMHIFTHRGVWIAILFGFPLSPQRSSFAMSHTDVSLRISKVSISELFLC